MKPIKVVNDSNGDPLAIGDSVYVVEHRDAERRQHPLGDQWGRPLPDELPSFYTVPERWNVIKAVIGYSREHDAITVQLDSSINLLRLFNNYSSHEVQFSNLTTHGNDTLILKAYGVKPLAAGFKMGCGCKLEDNQFQYCRLHQAASDIVSVMDAVLSHIALNGAIDAGHPLIALATKTVATVTTVTP